MEINLKSWFVVAVVASLSSEALYHTMGIVPLANQWSVAFCGLVSSYQTKIADLVDAPIPTGKPGNNCKKNCLSLSPVRLVIFVP